MNDTEREGAVSGNEGPGTVIGNYSILDKLGEGGFGTVFRAEQSKPVARQVALKIIKLGMDTRQVVARFEAERQAMALMDHPSIAKVYDAGTTETGRPFFVMELVSGQPIHEFCEAESLRLDQRLALFRNVCLAVQHAHLRGILHRDLKPSNILVSRVDGEPLPKVIDFGIAKALEKPLTDSSMVTEAFQVMGTLEYMSPEQSKGSDVDTRADVYALGVVLYQLLTGHVPFKREQSNFEELQRMLERIREEPPTKPSTRLSDSRTIGSDGRDATILMARDLRGDLDWIVLKALEKDREMRYSSPAEFADDIARHQSNKPVLASPPSTTYRLRKFIRRNRLLVAAAGVVAAALLAGAGGLVWSFLEVRSERDAANIARGKEKDAREAAERALAETEQARHEENAARLAEAEARGVAEESLAESDSVTGFLVDMLESVNPAQSGRDVTVRELLDLSSKQLLRQFENRPRVLARLSRAVGASYDALGLADSAHPHLETAVAIGREAFGADHERFGSILLTLGRLRIDQDRYEEAEEALLQARTIATLRSEHAWIDTLLGFLYTNWGRYEEAEARLLAAANVLEGSDLGKCLLNLGWLYSTTESYDKTEEAFLAARKHLEQKYGPEYPSVLTSRRHLAILRRRRGQLQEATRELRELADIYARVMGPEHPKTLYSLELVAQDYRYNGNFAAAIELFHEVIERRKKAQGDRHRDVGKSLSALGIALWQLRQLDEAEKVLTEAIDLLSSAAEEPEPSLLAAQNTLAIVHYQRGRAEQALDLWQALLELQSDRDQPIEVFRTRMNVNMVRIELGRFDGVIETYLEGFDFAVEIFGDQSDEAQRAMNGLAVAYFEVGRFQEAKEVTVELLMIRTEILGEDHPLTIATQENLALVLDRLGQNEEARTLLGDLLERRRRKFGPKNLSVAHTLTILADNFHNAEWFADAVDHYRQALEILEDQVDEHSLELGRCHHGLARSLVADGRLEEALPIAERAWYVLQNGVGLEHPSCLQAADTLVEIFYELDREQEADDLARMTLQLRERLATSEDATPEQQMSYAESLLRSSAYSEDLTEALRLATIANERTGGDQPSFLDVLAHAYRANGDLDNAARVAQHALDVLPEGAPKRAVFVQFLEEL
jgi:serine/threonine protein kinase/tetratricopeptide (TPR) repeat protein